MAFWGGSPSNRQGGMEGDDWEAWDRGRVETQHHLRDGIPLKPRSSFPPFTPRLCPPPLAQKVSKAAFKTEDKAEIRSTKRMSRSKLIMERQAAGFKTLQSYSTSPSSSEQAPILVSPRKLAASSNSFTSNLMSPMKRKAQLGGGGGSPPTSSRSMWSPREVNGVANQRSVSPEKGAGGVHEQGGGDENGVEVTRKLRVMNGLVYDVESGVIIGEDEAAKLAPFAAVSGDAEMMMITHHIRQLAVLHLGWDGGDILKGRVLWCF